MTENEELEELRVRVAVYEAIIATDPLREICLRLREISINLAALVNMATEDRRLNLEEAPNKDPPPVA